MITFQVKHIHANYVIDHASNTYTTFPQQAHTQNCYKRYVGYSLMPF